MTYTVKRPKYTREEVLALVPYWASQAAANRAVQYEIRAGRLQPARLHACVDCGNGAHGYDHRDYSKPLDVVPVCASCNAKRGPASFRQPEGAKAA